MRHLTKLISDHLTERLLTGEYAESRERPRGLRSSQITALIDMLIEMDIIDYKTFVENTTPTKIKES